MPAHNLYLKNSQIYDQNSEPIQGLLEAKAVMKIKTEPVHRLRQGEMEDIVSTHTEVTLTVAMQNAELKYFIIDQIKAGKTPIIPLLVGEHWDKEKDTKERVSLTNIRLVPEELTLFQAKADGNDKGQYEIRGKTNDMPEFIDRFQKYVE